jgi:hypothetical protein
MSLILSGMVNICQFVAGIPTFLYLDKMGRRKIAIFGGTAMGVPHMNHGWNRQQIQWKEGK